MFAIYPVFDKEFARSHAVVFTEHPSIADALCHYFSMKDGIDYEAYLVLSSWPDPQLINNLNGCNGHIYFSVRNGRSATDASAQIARDFRGRMYMLEPDSDWRVVHHTK